MQESVPQENEFAISGMVSLAEAPDRGASRSPNNEATGEFP